MRTRPFALSICAAVFLLLPLCAGAQTPAEAPPASAPAGAPNPPVDELQSPRDAMRTFLDAMGRAHDNPEGSAARTEAIQRAISTLQIDGPMREAGRTVATQLLGVINRIGDVNLNDLPDERWIARENVASFTFFPRRRPGADRIRELAPNKIIELVQEAPGVWKFSKRTVLEIGEFYTLIEDIDSVAGFDETSLSSNLTIRGLVPHGLKGNLILSLEYWQWIGLFIIAFIAVFIDFIVRSVLRVIALAAIRKREGQADPKTLKRALRPFGLFAGSLMALSTIWLLLLPPDALALLLAGIRFLLTIAGVWAAFRVADLASEVAMSKASATRTKIDDLLIPLVRKSAKIFIVAFGVVYLANSVGLNILPLLTGLGIGGLAVAFAAKDTIENFFGSVAVIADHPFEVGDWIVVGDVEGTVEELGFRSTRVRTFYNSLVTVPNATLVRTNVDNYGKRRYRRFSTHLSIAYETPPERIDAFCEGVRELVRLHPYMRKDYYHVYLHKMSEFSLDVMLYVFFDCPNWETELRERHRLLLDILRLAAQLGVNFAYPTQTLMLHRGADTSEHTSPTTPAHDADADSVRTGLHAVNTITAHAPWRTEKPHPVIITRTPLSEGMKFDETSE